MQKLFRLITSLVTRCGGISFLWNRTSVIQKVYITIEYLVIRVRDYENFKYILSITIYELLSMHSILSVHIVDVRAVIDF